ncbi:MULTISPECIES: CpsB/CapC family capsule biosynthesis tyrosine phosphatase [unclassified Spirosoma]|uniref:tyrosine-protein phosphatase n=1 Tax=unclassified Spirosoma TaxID=2621999 RepID=UPI000961E627|nr:MULTISPECIES: CpsB/CapC family capsule biosynthesis tyrosine phosphatase [unclassified Spirosoma]MBN8820655.1 histidinol-phosphatase [Spirosoma sp.]OJW78030.1 MAG: histidinol-phosphatase [Spirosoma sp. 48-14]
MWKDLANWLTNKHSTVQKSFADIWPVDLHNHILPGVDDGLPTLEDTLTCLQKYVDWGIKGVICTPHISQDYYPNKIQQLQQVTLTVQQAIADANLPIRFTLAAEYLVDEWYYTLLEQNEVLCFGKDRYVLFETGWANSPRQLEQYLFLMQLKGYKPVLAHPERYHYYQSAPEQLMALKEKGCLFQLNLMSLAGHYGKRAQQLAHKLLQTKDIDFIGSDLHRLTHLTTLEQVFDPATLDLLRQQPLLNNQLS